ncbi:RNA helicase [Coprinopsis sp. MPI-PUGE-AT-0042]|nr:RNA helicase [Coprinopsis sp. MPI-PUGE-AT-0042]
MPMQEVVALEVEVPEVRTHLEAASRETELVEASTVEEVDEEEVALVEERVGDEVQAACAAQAAEELQVSEVADLVCQDFVPGRRKLTDIDSLERGGRTEVARDMPPHSQLTSRDDGLTSDNRRPPRTERTFRSEPRPSSLPPAPSSATPPSVPQTPFYRPKEQLDYGSTLSSSEFSTPSTLVSMGTSSLANTLREAPKSFSSPPLLPGLVDALKAMLNSEEGNTAKPTAIQQLSLKWILGHVQDEETPFEWGQWLLAAETGSGKSFAYLLPLLQALKESETRPKISAPQGSEDAHESTATEPPAQNDTTEQPLPLNPRAIILAPTHELSRQISSFSKSLLYNVKLRVLCASKNNADIKSLARSSSPTSTSMELSRDALPRKLSARDMAHILGETSSDSKPLPEAQEQETQELEISRTTEGSKSHPVDVVVGTPMKIMDMVRGRWWDLKPGELGGTGRELDRYSKGEVRKDGRVERAKTQGRPEMGLQNVEWVVIDEADVLLDPDFQEVTRTLLADIAAAKGEPIKLDAFPFSSSSRGAPLQLPSPDLAMKEGAAKENTNANALEYPFNLVLTSATIPFSLSRYLDLYHPRLMRLVSPRLHRLPESLKVEYVKWTGGNRFVDVERRVREVWAGDAVEAGVRRGPVSPLDISAGSSNSTSASESPSKANAKKPGLSKILIFCNKSSKVDELSNYLEEKGIKNVAVTSGREAKRSSPTDEGKDGGVRTRGSNKYLDGFLRPIRAGSKRTSETSESAEGKSPVTTEGTKPLKNPYMLSDPSSTPHVLLTTSLLSRGLDFDPSIKHVFIVDEPRNMVDFLHRAGRSGRMGGEGGKVVIFGRSGSASSSSQAAHAGSFASRAPSHASRDGGKFGRPTHSQDGYEDRRSRPAEDRFRVSRERLNLGARQTGAGGGMHEAARRMERDEERTRRRNGPSASKGFRQ